MESFIVKQVRRLPGCLIFLLATQLILCDACREHKVRPLVTSAADSAALKQKIANAFQSIKSLEKEIRSGDLVTRTGNDFTSQSLRKLNRRDKTYSHCGIASIENDSLFIYHAIGGEWNPDEKLKRDPWVLFAEPYSNNAIGIFRFDLDAVSRKQLISGVHNFYTEGLPFDMDFDLETDDRMYCAEFVSKSITKATNKEIEFTPSRINKFIFVGVDDLFLHPSSKKVNEMHYQHKH